MSKDYPFLSLKNDKSSNKLRMFSHIHLETRQDVAKHEPQKDQEMLATKTTKGERYNS